MTDQPETDLSKLTLEQLVGSAVPISVDRDYPGTREEIITDVVAALRLAGVVHPVPETLGYALARISGGAPDVSPVVPTREIAKKLIEVGEHLNRAFGTEDAVDFALVRIVKEA